MMSYVVFHCFLKHYYKRMIRRVSLGVRSSEFVEIRTTSNDVKDDIKIWRSPNRRQIQAILPRFLSEDLPK
jgi:hypothetical protein